RRHKHPRRAGAHAEMARRAGAGKMLDAPGAGRRDRARHAQRNSRRLALDDLLRLLGDTGESQEIHSRVENEFPSLSIQLRLLSRPRDRRPQEKSGVRPVVSLSLRKPLWIRRRYCSQWSSSRNHDGP
ncbi:MAG: hypothetical protein WCA04_03250, partial [Geobacteraceae bacterium]